MAYRKPSNLFSTSNTRPNPPRPRRQINRNSSSKVDRKVGATILFVQVGAGKLEVEGLAFGAPKGEVEGSLEASGAGIRQTSVGGESEAEGL
ncbi:unnamed protein product [Protopolystoma xenopodis]|uniref:Uncharacterized protein n=1 Tax=Protopolystoma xenopodis TaxID=117903 RepID=A0A448XQ37_9PLAT|nr:unnamed protein product [Protopolystoma xenopodis]